jgi:hypothetical protein
MNVDLLFLEAGHKDSDIDETIDATTYQDELKAIAQAHHTQRHDGEKYLQMFGDKLGMNYFIVKT